MQSRWMKRRNENGDQERFYPITHADAVIDLDTKIQENIESVTDSLSSHIENTDVHFSPQERDKLNTIEEGANKTIVDSSLSTNSTNPVQNQVITNWLADNVKNYRLDVTHNSGTVYLTDSEVSPAAAAPEEGGDGGLHHVYSIQTSNGDYAFGTQWSLIKDTPTTLAGYGLTDAESKGAATSMVNTHNVSASAHNDIRDLVSGLSTKVNNFLNVNDTTKDQLSEIIALIEANADDIEKITSGKINVTDIVDNLTTNITNKPLSASQGVAIKALIDALQGSLDTEIANRESANTQSINTAKSYTDTSIAN